MTDVATPLRPKIGELLAIDATVLDRALAQQRQAGGVIGEHLLRLGAVDDSTLLRALSRQTGLAHVDLTHVNVAPEVLSSVKLETVRARRVLPVGMQARTLILGMVNPEDLDAVAAVQFESGRIVRPVLLSGGQLDRALSVFEAKGYGVEPLHLEPAGAPVSDDLVSMLRAVIAGRAQDLHLSAGAIPSIKVDGELHRLPLAATDADRIAALVAPFLTEIQRATFAERLELDFALSVPDVGRFRCNLYRQRGTIAFAARHVVERIPSLAALGLPPFLREFAGKKQGLVLVVGPTGHGKSTTLASIVDIINHERRAHVITIEDPIEYLHQHHSSNVDQREVGTDTRSFAEGLRHAFRQDPDVLVIGELRDHESTSIALTAAETGHLVLATLHGNDATAAIDRIVDLYPGNQQAQVRAQLADALLLVFSQRLIKRAKGDGRVVAWERMSSSIRVRNAIREGRAHSLRALMQSNMEELASIDQSLATLVVSGSITREEARKWADSPSYLDDILRARGVAVPS
ncbi:MAG: PilT/PilU family type 4a pilus ATPase [Polyangiales bacterium]